MNVGGVVRVAQMVDNNKEEDDIPDVFVNILDCYKDDNAMAMSTKVGVVH